MRSELEQYLQVRCLKKVGKNKPEWGTYEDAF